MVIGVLAFSPIARRQSSKGVVGLSQVCEIASAVYLEQSKTV